MCITRRAFLSALGLTLTSCSTLRGPSPSQPRASFDDEWEAFRAQFELDPNLIHMSGMLFASHPTPVREAIARHRAAFDRNPAHYVHHSRHSGEEGARGAAGKYLEMPGGDIALTDSTTMGLGLLYPSLQVSAGQEILTSTHDHYVTEASLSFLVERTAATLKRISLYEDSARADASQIVDRIAKNITARTRVVALTFVHSCSGVKLPIAAIGAAIAERNRGRASRDRILFCVDGVHGFGVEDITFEALGCDFLAAGTHKWLHGPRGTGILAGKTEAWDHVRSTIPTFSTFTGKPGGQRMTPGGFHSYEHRWALKEAFEMHLAIGKAKIQKRIHDLNTHMKEGMSKIPGVVVHTPLASGLSSGIICFSVRNLSAVETVKRLDALGVVATDSPYKVSYARVTPGLLNNHSDVERTLAAIAKI